MVRIDFSEPLAALPNGFSIQTPRAHRARLAGRDQRASAKPDDINLGDVRTVNVVQAGERTRLVLNLKRAAELPRRRSRASR